MAKPETEKHNLMMSACSHLLSVWVILLAQWEVVLSSGEREEAAFCLLL